MAARRVPSGRRRGRRPADGLPTERLAATLPRVVRVTERADVDAGVGNRLLIGELPSPAACPPTETVTRWDGWSR